MNHDIIQWLKHPTLTIAGQEEDEQHGEDEEEEARKYFYPHQLTITKPQTR